MVTGKHSFPCARPGGIRMAWVPSAGRWWRCDLRIKRNRSPMPRFGSSGWARATAVPPFTTTVSTPSISGANSDDRRAHCVTPRLLRIHAVPATVDGDDTSMSIHLRPCSSATNTSRTGQLLVLPGIFLVIIDSSIDLGLVNYLQYGALLPP